MEIEILERKAFDIKIGETVLEGFAVVSEWEGFQKLRSEKHGDIIIVAASDASKFSTYFEKMVGGGSIGFTTVGVLRASPDIIALLKASEGVAT